MQKSHLPQGPSTPNGARCAERSRVESAAISSGTSAAPLAKRTRSRTKGSSEDCEYEIDEILEHGYNEKYKQVC